MQEWVFNHNVCENYFCKLRKLRKLYLPKKSLKYLNDSENMLKNEGLYNLPATISFLSLPLPCHCFNYITQG